MASSFKNHNKIGKIFSENIDDLIFILNEKFQCEYMNFQYFSEKIKIDDFIHPEDINQVKKLFKSIFKMGDGTGEAQIKLEGISFNWYEIKGRSFVDNEDNKKKILLICRDIRKFKELEFEYKKSQARFGVITNTLPEIKYWKLLVSKEGIVAVQKTREMLELVIDNIPQLIYWKDTNLAYLGCNRNFASKNKLKDPSYIIGKTDKDLIWLKNNLDYIQNCERNVIYNDKPEFKVIESFISVHGRKEWYEINRIPLHDLEGKVEGILSTYEDITIRRNAEQKLQESEEKYRSILDNIKEGYFEVDLKGTFTFFNNAFSELVEIPKDDLIGINFQDFVNEENKIKIFTVYNELYSSDNPVSNFQFQFIRKSGEEMTCESSIYLHYNSKGYKIGFNGLARNITEKFLLEQKIKESEIKYRYLFENSPYSIILVNRNGKIIDCNPATERIFRKSMDSLINRNFVDISMKPENLLPLFIQTYNSILKGDVPEPIEVQISRLKDERKIWININYSLVEIGDETVIQVIIQDITEKKLVEQSLKKSQEELKNLNKELEQKVKERTKDFIESEEKYKNLSLELEMILDNIPALIFYKDLENNFIQVNKYLADRHNESKDFLKGKSLFELYPKEEAQAYWDDDLEVAKGRKPKLNIIEPWEPNQGKRWVNTSKIPIFDSNKNIMGILGISTDITESKRIEDQLKDSEEKFRNMVNNLDVGFYKGELRGKLTMHNQAVNKILGLKPSDSIIGLDSTRFFTNPEVQEKYYNNLLKNGSIKNFIGHIKKANGETIIVDLNAHLIHNSKGKPIEVEGTFTDITEKFKLEQELFESEKKLRQQNIELKKLDKTKTDFITMCAHELKTPLISISGYTDYILMKYRNQIKPEITEDLLTVQRNVNRLEVLMDQLLEVLKIDEHKLTLNKGMEDVSKIINNSIDELSYLINAKNLEIILNFDPKIILDVDPDRIFTVFTNLISNAIKFTPEYGWIEISTKVTENQYIFEIKDNGIGLNQDEIKRLFKKFERIKSPILSENIKFKDTGTGLGLYITQGIIKAHKGEIRAYSKGDNQGSTFIFNLPI